MHLSHCQVHRPALRLAPTITLTELQAWSAWSTWKNWGLTWDRRANGVTCALGVQILEAPAASTDFSDILEAKQL